MIDTETRATGVTLHLLDFGPLLANVEKQTGASYEVAFGPYAAVERDGVLYVVCNEGVGWRVTEDQPLELDLYKRTPGKISIAPTLMATLTIDKVRALMTDTEVDLADHIRRFGQRLEDNFWRLHRILAPQTWTFCGHWDGGEIIVDYVVNGKVEDDRVDDGRWEEGLWAAYGTGTDLEATQASVIAEYVRP